MYRRGFTIIELLIVISLMGILLVLGVANFRNTQANSRDSERAADISNIALNLESYYNSGNNGSIAIGSYPSIATLIGNESTILPDLDAKSLMAPSSTISSLSGATTGSPIQNPSISQYIYQPISQDGTLCSSASAICQKFVLYYKTEVDNVVQTVASKNQ